MKNKEQNNNKVSNNSKPSAYKEAESITYNSKISNDNYIEFDPEHTSEKMSHIKSNKVDENN